MLFTSRMECYYSGLDNDRHFIEQHTRSAEQTSFMIRSCAIIFICLALAELIVGLSGIRLPSALIGMLLLVILLRAGWVRLEWVRGISDFLLSNLGLFFVPPGVALMLHFDLIRDELLPIAAATLISTIAVFAVTGWVYQLMRGRR